MKGLWDWLNGKKTYIGAAITLLSFLATGLPTVLPSLGFSPAQIGEYVGIATVVVGLLHKLYKLVTGTDLP